MAKPRGEYRGGGARVNNKQPKPGKKRVKKAQLEDEEAKQLESQLAAGIGDAKLFVELPLSRATQEGLAEHKFQTLTTIQRASLKHSLAGKDILGAAKTGSGKTLAFLIPLLEKLFRARWTRLDGLGALVLTPTRELALQIFQELRKVGAHHEFSAGLLIGGKNVKEEQQAVSRMNVLVATPGRLLQHMDETPGFDASNLQILVLDEADRLLDMGFAVTLDAILDALPRERQTMLFSATQTKSVKDLARLSLQDPEYISVHEASDTATPLKLQQAVAVVPAEQKMDTLWSFIKSHLATKTIIFLSTCKQVRFVHEAFRKLRPGIPLRALHGGMKQMKRMVVFQEFCQAQHMVLFATDVAGRGLDFPSVDWVVQADCPEDAAAYIHRVGRTARYMSAGRALLLLTPGEADGMHAALAAAKIPVKPIKINPAKQQAVGPAVQALLSKDTQLKEWGQRALVAYVRSVFLAPAKDVFKVDSLDLEAMAASWGLAAAPRMRFLRKVGNKKQVVAELGGADDEAHVSRLQAGKVQQAAQQGSTDIDESEASDREADADVEGEDDSDSGDVGERARQQPVKQQKGPQQANLHAAASNSDDDADFLTVKRHNVFASEDGEDEQEAEAVPAVTVDGKQPKKKKMKIKVGRASGQRVVFDEEGQAQDPLAALAADPELEQPDAGQQVDSHTAQGQGVYVVTAQAEDRYNIAAQVLKKRDKEDKERLRELRAAAKAERKAKRKAALAAEQAARGAPVTVRLRGARDEDYDSDDAGYDSDDDQDRHSEGDSLPSSSQEDGSNGKWTHGTKAGTRDDDDSNDDSMSVDSGSLDSDDDGVQGVGRRGTGTEVAHAGMQHVSGTKRQRDPQQQTLGSNKKAKGVLSLAEQEALALARIQAGRAGR